MPIHIKPGSATLLDVMVTAPVLVLLLVATLVAFVILLPVTALLFVADVVIALLTGSQVGP